MGLITDIITSTLKARRAENNLRTAKANGITTLYEGGQYSRSRGYSPNLLSSPESATKTTERLRMMADVRELEEDFPIASLILDVFDVYAFGTIRYQPQTGDVDYNAEISVFLKDWFKTCEYSGRFDFTKSVQLSQRGKKRDGEAGIVHLVDEAGDYKFQLITGDRIGNPNTISSTSRNDQNGIIVDDYGRVEQFELYSRDTNSSTYTYDMSVDVDNFSHIADHFRPDNYHGVTAFKNIITRLRDLKGTLDDSRTNIRFRASQLPFLKTESGDFPDANANYSAGMGPDDATDSDGITLEHVQGLEQQVMKSTEGIIEYPNDFPNQSFLPVINAQMREIFAGVNLSYDLNWDINKLGGTVGRLVAEREDRVMQIERGNMEKQFMRVAISRAIQNGIDTGKIRGNNSKKFEGKFFYGPRISADYGRDSKADIALIDAGLLTEEEYFHIHGQNPDDVRSTRLDETLQLVRDGATVAASSQISQDNATNLIRKTYPQPPTVQAISETVQSGDSPR